MFYFTDDLLVGIEAIDKEHHKFFGIINDIFEVLVSNCGRDIEIITIKELIKQLRKYADEHFKYEEEYMKNINDPELNRQKKEHDDFRKMIYAFDLNHMDICKESQETIDLMNFLVRWLHHHIIGSDIMIGKFKKEENKESDPFAFAEKYRTGILFVDEEHKRLFEIIRSTYELIKAHMLYDKYDEIIKIIAELREYTIFHFGDEEEYMKKINYENIEVHKMLHLAFIEKINEINLEEVDSNQQDYLFGLIDFLLAWLDEHIMKVDKLIPVHKY